MPMGSECRGVRLSVSYSREKTTVLTLIPDTRGEEDCGRTDPAAPPPIGVANAYNTPRLLKQARVDEPVADGRLVVRLPEGEV